MKSAASSGDIAKNSSSGRTFARFASRVRWFDRARAFPFTATSTPSTLRSGTMKYATLMSPSVRGPDPQLDQLAGEVRLLTGPVADLTAAAVDAVREAAGQRVPAEKAVVAR